MHFFLPLNNSKQQPANSKNIMEKKKRFQKIYLKVKATFFNGIDQSPFCISMKFLGFFFLVRSIYLFFFIKKPIRNENENKKMTFWPSHIADLLFHKGWQIVRKWFFCHRFNAILCILICWMSFLCNLKHPR